MLSLQLFTWKVTKCCQAPEEIFNPSENGKLACLKITVHLQKIVGDVIKLIPSAACLIWTTKS